MTYSAFYESKMNLEKISLDLNEKPLDADPATHESVVKRLAFFFEKMLVDQKSVADVWKPAGEWKNYNEEKNFLYTRLLSHDYENAGAILKNFWRNKLGLIVKEYARFETLEQGKPEEVNPFLRSILRNYIIWKDIYHFPAERLKLTVEVGNPWGCLIDGVLVTPKATRFHNNAMQLKNLLKACNGNVIAEIGAGYGGLCHYLLKEIPGIRYIDFDLPETLVLAAYYLIFTFPEKKIFLYSEQELNEKNLSENDVILLPNYAIKAVRSKSVDVFFNSFSLSEMTLEANKEYLANIYRLTKAFFQHNNMDRKGVVNRGFERIPASEYPINDNQFILINKNYDLFHSHFGDYKEFLYQIK